MATHRSDFGRTHRSRDEVRHGAHRTDPTPEERVARERLQADPGPWRAPNTPLEVVEYTVDVDVDPEQADALRAATADLRLYTGAGKTASLKVLHGAGWSRIELARNVLGQGSIVVRAPGGHILFLDPGGRTFLHLAAEQLPDWRDRPAEEVRVSDRRASEQGTARRQLEIVVGALRAEVELDPEARLQPFAGEALSFVLGINPAESPELARLQREGFPVAGATWLAAESTAKPTLRWSVRDPRVHRADPALFDVPGQWTDLRDTQAVALHAPQGGYTMDVETDLNARYDGPLDRSWFVTPATLKPVPVGAATGFKQDLIGSCIDSRYGNAAGLYVDGLALDDVRRMVNLALRRVSSFMGQNGVITVDWLKQVREYSQALPDGDGVYHLLRWSPNPDALWPPALGDPPGMQTAKRIQRFGGIGLIDRIAERGARRLLANGQQSQLILPVSLLAACAALVANPSIAPADRFAQLSLDDQALLREIYAEQSIGYLRLKYMTEGKIQELPKGDTFPKDLVRYKLYDLSLRLELHAPDTAVADRGEVLETFSISGPNSVSGSIKLHEIGGTAVVLRWPGWAYGAFAAGVVLSCLFVPTACAMLAPLAGVATWLVLDAASVEITLRSPRIDFVVSWVPDPTKTDKLLYPTVQTEITTSSRTAVYITAVPDGLHQIIDAVISLALSFSTDLEEALADEIRDQLQGALRDDAKLVYPPGQGGLGQTVDSAGAFPGSPQHVGLGGFYQRPDQPLLPGPWSTQVDTLDAAFARMADLNALYVQAFPPPHPEMVPRSRPYAVLAWSVNVLNAFLWTLWVERRFDLMLPADPIGTALADAIAAAMPDMHAHRDAMRLLCPSPPRLELTPWTYAGGARDSAPLPAAPFGDGYARVSFDDVRLCAPIEGSDAVLELCFPASVVADVALGAVNASGALDLFGSPETSFDLLFDLPTVSTGAWFTAAARVKDGPVASPLAIDDMKVALADAVRRMLTPREATALERFGTDARNVQRYGLGPLALTSVMVPAGGYLYAYIGLPRVIVPGIIAESDPVAWLADPSLVPASRSPAQSWLIAVNGRLS